MYSRFFGNNSEKKIEIATNKKNYVLQKNHFENKYFELLVCAIYKKPIELYGFALYFLGVLAFLYNFKSNKVQFLTIFMS